MQYYLGRDNNVDKSYQHSNFFGYNVWGFKDESWRDLVIAETLPKNLERVCNVFYAEKQTATETMLPTQQATFNEFGLLPE